MVIRPAGLTVHPPPPKKKIDRGLFFAGYPNFFPQRKSGFRKGYSELKPHNVYFYLPKLDFHYLPVTYNTQLSDTF